jgi:hypothetical protein
MTLKDAIVLSREKEINIPVIGLRSLDSSFGGLAILLHGWSGIVIVQDGKTI